MDPFIIDFIDYRMTFPLRKLILRPNAQTLEQCYFESDELATSFHIGLFINPNQMVAIASYHNCQHRDFPEKNQYQLRGMATDPNYRGKGLGQQLFQHGLQILKNKKIERLWCNARISSLKFYLNQNMKKYGEIFDIPNIGPHQLMGLIPFRS